MMTIFERAQAIVTSGGDRDDERQGGFTLIELLAVVIVMGVLVAIAIPLYLHFSTNAEDRSIQADVHNAINTVQSCAANNGGKYVSGKITNASGSVYLTCKSDGSGTAALTKPAAASSNETINLSPSVSFNYTPSTDQSTFVITASYGDTSHSTVKYDSSTGKTTVSPGVSSSK